VVFDRDTDFRPYKPLYQGKPKDLTGFFLARPDEVTIAMTTDVPNRDTDPREVIYHEYVHLLLNARDARYPLWLNEGLAELFSTFRIADGKVVLGEPKNQHVAFLQQNALWPLARLFAVTRESPDYNEDARMGIFYAESWAFTHYLVFGADRTNANKLNRFAQRLVRGDDIATSFRETFALDFGTQEDALRNYLSGGSYYKGGTPAVAQNIPVAFRPASDLERDVALLNLRWRVHQNPEAAAAALALLDKDPRQARPHELLAAIAASSGDLAGAQEHWQRAAERNSDNPWVYLQLLREPLAAYEGAAMLDVRLAPPIIAPWRAWAGRAWDLSPENHEAIASALTIEALADKMDLRVVNHGQRQVLHMRDPARALLALAVIHWRCNQPGDARYLADLADAEPRADLATRAATSALRYRLPAAPAPASPSGPADAKHVAGIALQTAHAGDAAELLDRLLAERGSTAPRLKLDRLVVHASAHPEPDDWDRTDLLRESAPAGNANAMFDLAVAHACGRGVEYSPTLAREWLQQAADHGHAIAKAGHAPAQLDLSLVVRYLRAQAPAVTDGTLPPLDGDLDARIAEAAAASDRHPPVLVYRAAPRFPSDLPRHNGKGEAAVRFTIRADGHPDSIEAAEFSDPASAAAAEQCVRGWRFLPTIRDGKPVDTLAEVAIAFEVEMPTAAQRPASAARAL
jgi:TPR repeat protein